MKKYRIFLSENFQFLEVKFSIYMNRRVFVMRGLKSLCRIWLTRPTTLYGVINPYGDKKAYTSQSDFYGSIMKPVYDFAQPRLQIPLRKHAYSNILRILPAKNEKFQMKNSGSFHISVQNIDCGYSLEPPHWGGSNEYPQSMFLSRNKKNKAYPCKPQFYYIKVGFKGVRII